MTDHDFDMFLTEISSSFFFTQGILPFKVPSTKWTQYTYQSTNGSEAGDTTGGNSSESG